MLNLDHVRLPALSAALALVLSLGLLERSALAQDETHLAPVEITPHFVVPATIPIRGALLLRRLDGKEEDLRRVPLVSLEAVSLRLPQNSLWEVSGELPELWVRRATLSVGPPERATHYSLPLWPLGKISGLVKVEAERVSRPARLLIKTLEAPAFLKRPPVPPGALDCPIDEKGAWSCSLPAATYDLVISADGFTPHYRWAVQVAAGKTRPLGTIHLKRGASVAGWVVGEGGVLDETCVARLGRQVAGGSDLRHALDVERTAAETPVRKDGFFQLSGLAPGVYTLEIHQAGYAPARLSPVRIDAGAETFLREPLILTRPLDFTFEIDPPRDWLGKPWSVQLFRAREASARLAPQVYEGTVNTEGRFTVSEQPAGRYHITVLDSRGNRFYTDRDLELSGSTDPQRIEIGLVDLEGTVHLGQEALPGILWFGGKNGEISMRLETDAEGRYFGTLPQEGLWIVEIEAKEPRLRSRAQVDVRPGPSGKGEVDIDLPDTRVFGRVVDEQGKPVAKADVTAESQSPFLWTKSDEAGAFELRGLQEGVVKLGAGASSQASEPVSATLVEGRSVGPIELRLRRLERRTGRVVSPRGPVAGAQVVIGPYPSAGGGSRGTTGPDGSFSVEIPSDLRQAVAFVGAPGFAFRVLGPVEVASMVLPVTEEAGTLEITFPGGGEALQRQGLVLKLSANGFQVPLNLLRQWAADHGQAFGGTGTSLRFPALAVGDYRVCVAPRQLQADPQGLPAGICDGGHLAAGATLSLKPEPEEHQTP